MHSLTGALSPLKNELKKTHVDAGCAHANWQSKRVQYFLRPTNLRCLEKRSSGKAPRPRDWTSYSQTRSTGPERLTLSKCILDKGVLCTTPFLDRQRLPLTLRNHVRSSSALSALKKSLVANLSAIRQISVAKLSTKRIFFTRQRDFLVANGRMAADFLSPGHYIRQQQKTCWYHAMQLHRWTHSTKSAEYLIIFQPW